jgi:hypothetical protein
MKSTFYFVALCLFSLVSNSLPAQEKQSNTQTSISDSKKQKNDFIDKLDLDEEQAIKFDAINKTYEENVKALKIKTKSKRSTKKLKALEKERDKEIKELLSKDQFTKYIELRREKRNSLKTLIRKSNGQ